MDERNRSCDGYILWIAMCAGALLALLIMANGCHTIHGIGTDLKDIKQLKRKLKRFHYET